MSSMTKLTSTQAKALEYIRTSIERSGVAPTLREICTHMGYKAVGSAQDLVSALRKKGFIEENERQSARTYLLTPLARRQQATPETFDLNTFVIPCLGTVPAGNPALAMEERIGVLRMSMSLLPRPQPKADELFALQATGESMIGAGILDGDWLVVKVNREPPKDAIVVARVEGDVTVKRLMKGRDGQWFLRPENPSFSDIHPTSEAFEIVGQVVALQRAIT